MQITYFIKRFEESLKERWNQLAIDEFRKSTITYSQLAEAILKKHLLYRRAGLKREDKIAINARSCAKWGRSAHKNPDFVLGMSENRGFEG